MDRGQYVDDVARRGDSAMNQDPLRSEIGSGPAHSPGEDAVKHGVLAATVKGAFKIALMPAMRARAVLSTLTDSWSDLVAEARREYEARDEAEVPTARAGVAGVEASHPRAPATEVLDRPPAKSRRPVTSGSTGKRRASRATRDDTRAVAAAPQSVAGPARPDDPETPASPTLVETGESSVEVWPNPAISPAHVTSGVTAHIPPEVRHKLGGNGPIRA